MVHPRTIIRKALRANLCNPWPKESVAKASEFLRIDNFERQPNHINQFKTSLLPQDLHLKQETHKIIGTCMEVHRHLGHGFLEIVYKDAIEYEFRQREIPYEREKRYDVKYKDVWLPHNFFADFVVYDEVILEVKATDGISDEFIARTINYLKVSGNKVALIVNFGRESLEWKRLVY